MRVATFRTSGMFAGKMRVLRHIQGPQLWRVVLSVQRDDGYTYAQTVAPRERCTLLDIEHLAGQSIKECCGATERLKSAMYDIYIAKS